MLQADKGSDKKDIDKTGMALAELRKWISLIKLLSYKYKVAYIFNSFFLPTAPAKQIDFGYFGKQCDFIKKIGNILEACDQNHLYYYSIRKYFKSQ